MLHPGNDPKENKLEPPGERLWLPLPRGWVRRARRAPVTFYQEAFRKYGDVALFKAGPLRFYFLAHPDHVKHVLQENVKNYPRSWFYNFIKLALGEGLVTSEGDFWRRQRRLAQPAFHRQRLAGLAPVMTRLTAAMLERWQGRLGQSINVAAEMSRLALGIASTTLCSCDISGEADVVGQALNTVIHFINDRMNRFLRPPLWLPTPGNLRFKRALRILNTKVYGIIEQRRREKKPAGDLLDMFLEATDEETGLGMTDRQLRDELLTFLMAGHETTAVAMAWTWYLLSLHPEVRRRLHAEVAGVLQGRVPAADDVPQLKYTRMVIEESLRLYPPVYGVMRDAAADDEIGGFPIPAKSYIVLCQFITHRHPAFWENPEGFDPERFTPERVAQRPRYAYFPFAGGPHQCIGNDFALLEAVLVVAMVSQRFCLDLVPGHPVELEPTLTLRPRQGIWMTVDHNS